MTTAITRPAVARRNAYIWVTWVTKLLAGEASCEFAAWFRAHYQYDKLPGDFDLSQWKADHTELVRVTAEELHAEGYRVTVEDQNAFRMVSERGTYCLAGKPDIVAVNDAGVLVVDCKTGQQRESDVVQVQIYQAVLGRTKYKGMPVSGRVQYRSFATDIPAAAVDAEFVGRLRRLVSAVGGSQALPAVPSARECGWCDIGPNDCSARTSIQKLPILTDHGLF